MVTCSPANRRGSHLTAHHPASSAHITHTTNEWFMNSLRHFPCIITHAGRLQSQITDMMQPHHRAYLWALLVHYPEVVTSPILVNNDSGCWVCHTAPPPFHSSQDLMIECVALLYAGCLHWFGRCFTFFTSCQSRNDAWKDLIVLRKYYIQSLHPFRLKWKWNF